MDLRPPIDDAFAAFGVPATVIPVGGSAITTQVIVDPPASFTTQGLSIHLDPALGHQRRLSLRRDQVPVLPIGSVISVPLLGGGIPQTFKVDRVDAGDPEVFVAVTH